MSGPPRSCSLETMTRHPDDAPGEGAFYRTLLESTRAIPWRIDWASGTFSYIGPQIEKVLGWPPSSWVSIQDWADRIHADDRERVVQFCVAQSEAGVDHEADYRALTRSGDYVWIRDVVHVLRDDSGRIEALVGFMFDISERRRNEEKLAALQAELERLSYQDPLTGVGNRRRFDEHLRQEWLSARRNDSLLALVMLDIDHFKAYNDHYGHLQGDECLKRVADIMRSVACRPRDLVCRFGGEEFVMILPETSAEAAVGLAEECRDRIRQAAIEHRHGGPGATLTVSMGVASCSPEPDQNDPEALVREVDRRLYKAKQLGRDNVIADGQSAAS
jgi:diguanylate cyclase (GGDEF)-like protein/PAS domain S-box-containing protein